MNKDVIYIDVEDDITAIISKVKASKEKIVALVPPKRVGVLQSAVNLRLLNRASTQGDKRLVLITNNHALMSLAASAGLPVAKNLQTKPELAEIAALDIDDGDDVIDGNDLPIGDHAKQGEISDDTIAAVGATSVALAEPPKTGEALRKAKPKSGIKVPNFNTFRKKMILGIGLAILLIAFLVWAIFIAPRATVVVSAKTNSSSVNAPISVSDKLVTSAKKGTIKATIANESEDKTIDFVATGTKNVGETAAGTVEFQATQISQLGTVIPAGTRLRSTSGLVFTTNDSVTITVENYSGAPVNVTAADRGAKYNAASGDVSGAPDGISATFTSPTSGGTDKTVKVVTVADVQTAKEQLVKDDTKSVKTKLKDSFKGDVKVLDESFAVDYQKVTATPAIDVESANGKAVLTSTVNYRLYAIDKNELTSFLDDYLKDEVNKAADQRVYSNGVDKASIQDIAKTKNGVDATLVATAKIGPKLDEDNIKNQVRGKKFGDIQQAIESIQGVENVDVKFFPFWVSTVPDDTKRISVEFKVNESQ